MFVIQMSIERKLISVRNACCCCLSTTTLHPLHGFQQNQNDKQENYAKMIATFFSIQILCNENIFMICEACISQLQLAYTFIKQVEEIQVTLQHASAFPLNEDIKIKNEEILEQSLEINISEDEIFFSNDSDADENHRHCENNIIVKYELDHKNFNDHKHHKNSVSIVKYENNDNHEHYENKLNIVEYKNSVKQIPVISNNIKSRRNLSKNSIKNFKKKSTNSNSLHSENNENINSLNNKNSPIPHHRILKNAKEPYKLNTNDVTCKICNETFPLHMLLVRHMPVHFPNYICHTCGKYCTTKKKLTYHMIQHLNIRHTCKVCNKSYKGLSNYRKHVKYHFEKYTAYKCPECSERFPSYYKRMKHLIEVHGDDPKKYKCKHCSKSYLQACALKRHIRNVHLQERNYECDVCGSTFFNKQLLSNHMLKHTGIKHYRCDICQKDFARKYTLTEHLRIHKNDKRFVCNICNKSFTQKCTLKGHMKVHEKEVKNDRNLTIDGIVR